MPRPRKSVPTYRHHKQSGQAIVTLRTSDGGRRDVILGPYDSPESHEAYERVIGELRDDRPILAASRPAKTLSVNEVLRAYNQHAEQHYRHPDGQPTSELLNVKLTLRLVRQAYGTVPATKFGPVALKAVRQKMIDKGWCRTQINQRVSRIRRAFRWAVSEELIPAMVFHGLTSVQGLQAGRTPAKESEPVRPVSAEAVSATLPHFNPTVRAMVEVQLLTGMRPGEVCRLRPRDLDESAVVWLYRPETHKTSWRGKSRVIAIGPKAQAILSLFRPMEASGHFFSPRRAIEEYQAGRTESRVTPLYPSHVKRNAKKRVESPKWKPTDEYEVRNYAIAITRACDAAFPPPAALGPKKKESREKWWARLTEKQREEVKVWRYSHRWHPNQLRHAFATRVRKEHGLEAAQVALGHAKADVTQVYAERDLDLAVRVAEAAG